MSALAKHLFDFAVYPLFNALNEASKSAITSAIGISNETISTGQREDGLLGGSSTISFGIYIAIVLAVGYTLSYIVLNLHRVLFAPLNRIRRLGSIGYVSIKIYVNISEVTTSDV